jgi:Family of unknown function (DUF6516)
MARKTDEHTLEFLLDFDGRIHRYHGGYWLKFEIRRVFVTDAQPHGLRYSFTLHGPDGSRLVGFDNAHEVRLRKGFRKSRSVATDHWHRTESDPGRPYRFKDAATLIDDFFNEVERGAHGARYSF